MSSFKLSTELTQILNNSILEWIQLNYHEEKEKTNRYYILKDNISIETHLSRILFFHKVREFVTYILDNNKIKNSHKVPIIQCIIEYDKSKEGNYYIDSILQWEKISTTF